jgi:RimJ/RimL family protein N-acetyltransferase
MSYSKRGFLLEIPDLPVEDIRTERLVLRQWRESDKRPYAELNSDAEVMRYFPKIDPPEVSHAAVDRFGAHIAAHGWGLWAVEHDGALLGFTGLAVPRFDAEFMPAVEIGWRFARHAWGNGFATEAARAAVVVAFERLHLNEIVSLTAVENTPSRRVMERLGMTHVDADDFEHPSLAEGHALRRHVLYRLRP